MRFLKYSAVPLFFFFSPLLFAAEQLPLSIHLDVTDLTKATAPRIVDNYLLFTYAAGRPTRFVGIAFENQDFRTIHPFSRNQHGIFFYLQPISGNESTVVYRLVVDGLWQPDPKNPDMTTDQSGIVLSKIVIPPRHREVATSPVVGRDGTVQFFFKAPPNQVVMIAGDFNNWDPFTNRLKQTRGDLYSATIRVSPGTHGYYFVDNGSPIADPLNPRVDFAPNGTKISVFTVP